MFKKLSVWISLIIDWLPACHTFTGSYVSLHGKFSAILEILRSVGFVFPASPNFCSVSEY